MLERGVPQKIVRWRGDLAEECDDLMAREEPLEIQIGGVPVAVVMRTPGHDVELALGFLLTERVLSSLDQVQSVRHCTIVPDPDAEDNIIQVILRDDARVDLERLRRNLYASSSCGVCGKATIENVLASAPPLEDTLRIRPEVLYRMPRQLRDAQWMFEASGGLHAAGLFDARGELLAVREDVGRHNAVDKVIGWALREGRAPLGDHLLMVSGRVAYEIVQKAAAARIPVVAAVSAPSSLAVLLARALGITLVGFLRGEGMNVYSGAARLEP